jgi:hypothetical protein
VRSLDVNSLLDRFENLEKKEFSPQSLATYRSRFKKGWGLYLSYLQDPKNYRPQSRERPSVERPKQTQGGGRKGRPREAVREAPEIEARVAARGNLVPFLFPVRAGVLAELYLPADLRREESERLVKYIQTLSWDQYLALPARSEDAKEG